MSLPAPVFELLELLSSRGDRISDTEVPEHLRNALKICLGNGPPLIARVPFAGPVPERLPPPIWKLTPQGQAALALRREAQATTAGEGKDDERPRHASEHVANLLKRKSEQATNEARARMEQARLAESGKARREALARVLDGANAADLKRFNTDTGRPGLVKTLIAAAKVPFADGTPVIDGFKFWPDEGEYWPVAREIVAAAERGNGEALDKYLRGLADWKDEEQTEVWRRVAQLMDMPPSIPPTGIGETATPTTRSSEHRVEAWIAEWRTKLEQDYPDPIERLRFLAFRCSQEHAWQAQRSTLATWQAVQEKLSDHLRGTRQRLEREQAEGKPIPADSPLFWSIFRQLQDDPATRELQREDATAHRLFWQTSFESVELYRLLWQYRPSLLADFGPPARLDESYTPRERSERCNAVLAKLLAERGGREPVGSWSPDRLKEIADDSRTLAKQMQAVLTMGTDYGTDGLLRLVLGRLHRTLESDAADFWTINDIQLIIVLRRLRGITSIIARDCDYLPSSEHIAALEFAATTIDGFLNNGALGLPTPPTSVTIPLCPGCGSPPAVEDVDDVCTRCGAYLFVCGIVEQVPLSADAPIIKQQATRPRWRRLPPSQVKARVHQQQAPAADSPATEIGGVDKPKPRPPKSKRSTVKGDARSKIVAALTLHHNYAAGGCLNYEPIKVTAFATRLGVAKASVSDFLKEKFGGYNPYCAACRNKDPLLKVLKILNDDFSDMRTYGRKPPGERRSDAD